MTTVTGRGIWGPDSWQGAMGQEEECFKSIAANKGRKYIYDLYPCALAILAQ